MRTKLEIESELCLLRWRQGEGHAFERLVRLWERRLFYYIRRIVVAEEDAWDVLQEVWTAVWRQGAGLRDVTAFRSWVYRIAHNCSVSHLRRTSRCEALEGVLDEPLSGEDVTFDRDEAARIHAGLEQLPSGHREILTLFFLEEFSHAEVAEILNIPVGTVKSRLYYAKRALRERLDSETTS
ncbi:MAG: sigma-70 family RNA polymerase sigma factor [Candidatus Hydrogenedentes bacterium]|nr:sigma-70 family RNA polymerase sigma factor [Candidatus Hydrogenedentota bacterium]